jgi:hypothetical protein
LCNALAESLEKGISLKPAVDGHKNAQKPQTKNDRVETIVTHAVKVSVCAQRFLLCFVWFFVANCFLVMFVRKREKRFRWMNLKTAIR